MPIDVVCSAVGLRFPPKQSKRSARRASPSLTRTSTSGSDRIRQTGRGVTERRTDGHMKNTIDPDTSLSAGLSRGLDSWCTTVSGYSTGRLRAAGAARGEVKTGEVRRPRRGQRVDEGGIGRDAVESRDSAADTNDASIRHGTGRTASRTWRQSTTAALAGSDVDHSAPSARDVT